MTSLIANGSFLNFTFVPSSLSATALILSDIVKRNPQESFTADYFKTVLAPIKGNFDWSSTGRFAFVGGKKGVQDVYAALKEVSFESTTR